MKASLRLAQHAARHRAAAVASGALFASRAVIFLRWLVIAVGDVGVVVGCTSCVSGALWGLRGVKDIMVWGEYRNTHPAHKNIA